jgi:hypothetical protein
MTDTQHWSDLVARQLVATALDEGAALLRWLDVGFGSGAGIAAALEAGVERVDGVDPDPDNVRAAGERFDRTVVGLRIGEIHQLGGYVGPYDVVLSSLAVDVTAEPSGIGEIHQLGGYVGPYDVVLSSLAVDVTAEPSALQSVHEVLSYGSRAWVALRERAANEPAGPGAASRDELAAAATAAGWTGEVGDLAVPGEVPFTVLVVSTEP